MLCAVLVCVPPLLPWDETPDRELCGLSEMYQEGMEAFYGSSTSLTFTVGKNHRVKDHRLVLNSAFG